MTEKTTTNYGFYGILKWEGSLLIPSFPSFSSPAIPSSLPLQAARGSVERCELPQWGVGEATTDVEFRHNLGMRNHIWWHQIVTFSYKLSVPVYQSNTIQELSYRKEITRQLHKH